MHPATPAAFLSDDRALNFFSQQFRCLAGGDKPHVRTGRVQRPSSRQQFLDLILNGLAGERGPLAHGIGIPVQPPFDGGNVSIQPDNKAPSLQFLPFLPVLDRSAAGCQNGLLHRGQFPEQLPFGLPEKCPSMPGNNIYDRAPQPVAQEGVHIKKGPLQPSGEDPAHRGLARGAKSGQNDIAGLNVHRRALTIKERGPALQGESGSCIFFFSF